jgi:hypothetical protein
MPYQTPQPKAGFYVYEKALLFQITVADTYHALHEVTASDITAGKLIGWTQNDGRVVDANITSEASGTGGKLRVVCSGAHNLTTGDIVVLGNMNDAGHNKPTRITTDGTNPTTEFLCDDITYVAGAGASAGTVVEPAHLKAGAGSAGDYYASFVLNGAAAAANKTWKFEFYTNVTPDDNIVDEIVSAGMLRSYSSAGFLTVAEGDKVWLAGKNITDTTDFTIKNANIHLFKV